MRIPPDAFQFYLSLANERSYRGLRRVGFWIGGPWFIVSFFYPLLEGLENIYLADLPTMLPWWGSLILLAVGYVARHGSHPTGSFPPRVVAGDPGVLFRVSDLQFA